MSYFVNAKLVFAGIRQIACVLREHCCKDLLDFFVVVLFLTFYMFSMLIDALYFSHEFLKAEGLGAEKPSTC